MIVIIAGTNRRGSKSSVMARCLSAIHDGIGVENQILELEHLPPETFSPDAYRDKPPKVLEFTEAVLASSGLVVVTPEYNGSMSGALKLFVDLLHLGRGPATHLEPGLDRGPSSFEKNAATALAALLASGLGGRGVHKPSRAGLPVTAVGF